MMSFIEPTQVVDVPSNFKRYTVEMTQKQNWGNSTPETLTKPRAPKPTLSGGLGFPMQLFNKLVAITVNDGYSGENTGHITEITGSWYMLKRYHWNHDKTCWEHGDQDEVMWINALHISQIRPIRKDQKPDGW